MFYTHFDEIFNLLNGKSASDFHGGFLPTQWLADRKNSICNMPSFPHSNVWLSPDMNTLNIEFALAGYDKDEITIVANSNSITIQINPVIEEGDREHVQVHNGISRRRVEFSLSVDKSFDARKAETSFDNGLLTLQMPKIEESRSVKLM